MPVSNKDFLRVLKQFEEEKLAQATRVTQALAFHVAEKCVSRSPVGQPDKWTETVRKRLGDGYEPGRYISSWFLGLDNVPKEQATSLDKSGDVSYDRILSGLQKFKFGQKIFIVNTARNERGEYYPRLLEKELNTRYPGYKNRIKAFAYGWFVDQQDSMQEIAQEALAKLDELVKTPS